MSEFAKYFVISFVVIALGSFLFSDKLNYTLVSAKNSLTNSSTTLLFVGDIMLDRGVRNNIEKYGVDYPFSEIKSLLNSTDLTIGNLEGTFTDNPSISQVDNSQLKFTFNPLWAGTLKDLGFDALSSANNHSLDFGNDGLKTTKNNLDKVGIAHFGSPLNSQENLSAEIKVGKENICIVGYHALYLEDTTSVINEIQRIRSECNYLVVFSHWGDEYKDFENLAQEKEGRSFIDAGADLVIGAHPHVVEPVEIYKGKAIFYSLGNFVFDQDFSMATRQGLALKVSIDKKEQKFEIVPIEMHHAKLYYPTDANYQPRLETLVSQLPVDQKNSVLTSKAFSLPR